MMFKDKMLTPAIPERVFALCKIVEKGAATTEELKEAMEPKYLGNGSVYFGDYKSAAEELGLITVSDDVVTLAVKNETVNDIKSMRQFINTQLEKFKTGQFYLVTKAYFEMGNRILNEDKNIANLAPLFSEKTGAQVDAVAMRAWRFWASFLGFGYLQDMFVIPNASVFLRDIINASNLKRQKKYTISDFVKAITPMGNIILSDAIEKTFSYGVSSGLRTLHESGVIHMEHIHDQEDIWTLYPMKSYSSDSTITNITIV